MKHQVVFGIWTARELRGEGGVANTNCGSLSSAPGPRGC
jgi:hypothetical protein